MSKSPEVIRHEDMYAIIMSKKDAAFLKLLLGKQRASSPIQLLRGVHSQFTALGLDYYATMGETEGFVIMEGHPKSRGPLEMFTVEEV